MPKADSSFNMLVVAAALALGIGYYVPQVLSQKPAGTTPATAQTPQQTPQPESPKAAARPVC